MVVIKFGYDSCIAKKVVGNRKYWFIEYYFLWTLFTLHINIHHLTVVPIITQGQKIGLVLFSQQNLFETCIRDGYIFHSIDYSNFSCKIQLIEGIGNWKCFIDWLAIICKLIRRPQQGCCLGFLQNWKEMILFQILEE